MRAILIVLAALVVGGIALGFYQDWFSLTVDQDKMREDAEQAKEDLQGVGKQIKEKVQGTGDKAREETGPKGSGIKTVTGRVTKVEAAANRFLMATADNGELTIYLDPSSHLRLNDQEVKLEELQVKDEVEVAYDLKDGKNLATSVTVNRNAIPKQSPRIAD